MEGFLDLKIPIWARVSFTRIVAIGPGILVAILTEGNAVSLTASRHQAIT